MPLCPIRVRPSAPRGHPGVCRAAIGSVEPVAAKPKWRAGLRGALAEDCTDLRGSALGPTHELAAAVVGERAARPPVACRRRHARRAPGPAGLCGGGGGRRSARRSRCGAPGSAISAHAAGAAITTRAAVATRRSRGGRVTARAAGAGFRRSGTRPCKQHNGDDLADEQRTRPQT